jgi:hypothetical protein
VPDALRGLALAGPGQAAVDALGDLRSRRRRNAARDVDWADALYHAYLAGILGIAVVLVLSGLVGDDDVAASRVADLRDHGPAWLGLGLALALLSAARSGLRGGPLALEAAEVRHVLLAPVPRAIALRRAAQQQLRVITLSAAAIGLVAGQLAVRRLPGPIAEWLIAPAVVGLVAGAAYVGTAMLVSGRRLPKAPVLGVALAVVAWSVVDVVAEVNTSPLSLAGGLALWPLHVDIVDVIGPVVLLALAVLGLTSLGGTSIEAAERRAGLVAQLRFAATLQDVRTVVLLRRQLSDEALRTRPWIRLRTRPRSRLWVARRGWQGILRWPAPRVARLVGCGIVAGLALRGVWEGTTPLVVVAGLALWIAALDAVEPLAQESDHPGRSESFPREAGILRIEHLIVPMVVEALVGVVAVAVALPFGELSTGLAVGFAALPAAAAAAVCGAAVAAVRPVVTASDTDVVIPPEVAGLRHLVRVALPPAIAIVGVLPIISGRNAEPGESLAGTVAGAGFLTWAVVFAVMAWLRYREIARAWWRRTQATAELERTLQAERRAARRAGAGS